MTRILSALILMAALAFTATAQQAPAPRAATGGAQTLEDILARQRGEKVESRERGSAADQAAGLIGQLGTLGGASDADVWTSLRYNSADIKVSTNQAQDLVLVQDNGMWWYQFRAGPLREYGLYLLYGMLLALSLFYLFRGKIRLEGERSGILIERFKPVERFGHWLLAGSFILLALTGLITLFGRVAIIPLFGKESFAALAIASKWVHNNVAWAFMLALILVFFFWVLHNIPNRHDLVWLAKGGGMFSKGTHPPAKKFNAGQKIIFWAVIILGVSVSLSGLSLLFPFQLPMFAKTFGLMNDLGIYALFQSEPFATTLTPHAEMQLSTLWHAIVAFVMIAIILAHIYLGTIGMEGAFDAMHTGEVDRQWAEEHHPLWLDENQDAPEKQSSATPAE